MLQMWYALLFCSLKKNSLGLKIPKPACTGACECTYCPTKKKRDSAELLSRVQRLIVERDGYKKQLAVERAEYEAYRADCVSKLDELRGSYSTLEYHCSQLEHELVEERKTPGINSLRKECEQQNRMISELRSRLLVAEFEIVEGEKTEKKAP